MNIKDAVTSKYFNQRVSFEADEAITIGGQLINLNLAARLTGAPDDARIVMTLSGGKATFKVYHRFFAHAAEYEVTPTNTGFMLISNVSMMLKAQHQYAAFGLRMFAHEAYTARGLGIQQIWLWAARDENHYNGYYSWPRYGFDAELASDFVATLPEEYSGIRCVQDLMSTDAGRMLWKQLGTSRMMCFDMEADRSWRVLEACESPGSFIMKASTKRGRSTVTLSNGSRIKEPGDAGRSGISVDVSGAKLRFHSHDGSVWMNNAAKKAIQQSTPKRLETTGSTRTKDDVLQDLEARSKKRFR